jgi:hypothetical protein
VSTVHTDELAADALIGARLRAARSDGYATAAAHERRVNPWRGDGDSAVERVLAVWWARGYSAAVDDAMSSSST